MILLLSLMTKFVRCSTKSSIKFVAGDYTEMLLKVFRHIAVLPAALLKDLLTTTFRRVITSKASLMQNDQRMRPSACLPSMKQLRLIPEHWIAPRHLAELTTK